MNRAILFASFLVGIAVFAQDAAAQSPVRRTVRYEYGEHRTVNVQGSTVEGGIPRLINAPNPLAMFSPFAPASYGSGRYLVIYSDSKDVQKNSSENQSWFQPDGLRLLTLRPFP